MTMTRMDMMGVAVAMSRILDITKKLKSQKAPWTLRWKESWFSNPKVVKHFNVKGNIVGIKVR